MRLPIKPCPRCAERVNRDAKVCRHCFYDFTDDDEVGFQANEAALDSRAEELTAKTQKGCIIGVVLVLALLALLFACAVARDVESGIGQDGIVVTKAQSGRAWPYPGVESGIIRCEPGTHQVTIELNGIKYGLNGKAQGQGDYEPSQSLSGIDDFGIVKLPPDEWIQRGLASCDY